MLTRKLDPRRRWCAAEGPISSRTFLFGGVAHFTNTLRSFAGQLVKVAALAAAHLSRDHSVRVSSHR
jgi:hypothetical protein